MAFECAIIAGNTYTDLRELLTYFESLEPGKKVRVTIRDWRPPRTRPQENYYRANLRLVANEVGMLEEELHRHLMRKCGYGSYREFDGVRDFFRQSSAKLSDHDYRELIHQLKIIAMDLGIILHQSRAEKRDQMHSSANEEFPAPQEERYAVHR